MSESWTTTNEIRFFQKVIPSKGMSKLEFLLNYKEAIKLRDIWDNLDKNEIEKQLNNEIEKEMNYGGNI